jgi:hypothetical protein
MIDVFICGTDLIGCIAAFQLGSATTILTPQAGVSKALSIFG